MRSALTLFFSFATIVVMAAAPYQKEKDSLSDLLKENPHDTISASAYVSLSEYYGVTTIDSILPFCLQAMEVIDKNLSNEISDEVRSSLIATKVIALNNIGYYYITKGKTEKAIDQYDQVKVIAEEIGDSNRIAGYYLGVGYIYNEKGDVEKALDYYHKGLTISEEIGATGTATKFLLNLANIYDLQGDMPKAMEIIEKCLSINLERDNKPVIANCYAWIAANHLKSEEYQEALGFYKKSLELREVHGDVISISYSLNKLGHCYYLMDSCDASAPLHERSLTLTKDGKYPLGHLRTLYSMGLCAMKTGEYDLAKQYATESMAIGEELENPISMRDAAMLLYGIHKEVGEYEQALTMYEQYIMLHDSLKNEQTEKATIRQQTKYEFEKAQLVKEQGEHETARLRAEATSRRDNLQYSVILIAILVLFGGILSLGFINIGERMAEGLIFFAFLIFFEFVLVLADPYVDAFTTGAPGWKLLINAAIAALIFPLHAFFESKLKGRLVKS